MEEQISTGKAKNATAYIAKMIQNEFGAPEQRLTYKMPDSIRKQLQPTHGPEEASEEAHTRRGGIEGDRRAYETLNAIKFSRVVIFAF